MSSASKSKEAHQRAADLAQRLSMVRNIAGRIRRRLPASVEMDDLVQAGLIGLNEALSRFEEGPGSNFESYAARRIEGAMLDALRERDTLPRLTRSRLREMGAAVQRLEQRLGRIPRAQEVANELGWPLERFHDCMVEAGAGGVRTGDEELEHLADEESSLTGPITYDGHHLGQPHADPMRALQQRQRDVALSAAFDALEEAERYVMESIYDRGLALRDIGQTLGISESRVSQMSAEIVAKLKRRLQDR
jgi:RNA polymerase sigma factor for flagellar operon FliA